MPYSSAANPGDVSRDHVVHVDRLPDTQTPVLSLVGGKWTTFRGFAESVADDVLARLRRTRSVSTRNEAIGGGRDFPRTDSDRAAWLNELVTHTGVSMERAEALLSRYGTTASAIATFCSTARNDGAEDTLLASAPAYTAAEIRYLCLHESVTHLADLLFRRTTIAVSGDLTGAVVMETAAIAARTLGWDAARTQLEIESVRYLTETRHGIVLRDVEFAH